LAGGQVDAEALQRLGDRVARAVGDRHHAAAVAVLHHHALEQVVDVIHLEAKIDLGLSVNLSITLEVADPTRVEDNLPERQRRCWGLPATAVLAIVSSDRAARHSEQNRPGPKG